MGKRIKIMGRTKGAKNKVKVKPVIAEKSVDDIVDRVVEATACEPTPKLAGESPRLCAKCKHPKSAHYGPLNNPQMDWCNQPGCQCLDFE